MRPAVTFLQEFMQVIWNGELLDETQVPALNRGLLFGDGLFETMIVENNKPRYADLHLKRLQLGCVILGLEVPAVDEQTFVNWLEALGANSHQVYRAKWVVWRLGAGTYSPESSSIASLFYIHPASKPHVAMVDKVAISQNVFIGLSPWSACKTLSALPYVLASKEKMQRGLDELILMNQSGHLAECSASNLFWVVGNALYTPSLASGCLAGVMRHVLIEKAKRTDFSIKEGLFEPEILENAELVFCTNVAGIKVFRQWKNRPLQTEHLLFENLSLLRIDENRPE